MNAISIPSYYLEYSWSISLCIINSVLSTVYYQKCIIHSVLSTVYYPVISTQVPYSQGMFNVDNMSASGKWSY